MNIINVYQTQKEINSLSCFCLSKRLTNGSFDLMKFSIIYFHTTKRCIKKHFSKDDESL